MLLQLFSTSRRCRNCCGFVWWGLFWTVSLLCNVGDFHLQTWPRSVKTAITYCSKLLTGGPMPSGCFLSDAPWVLLFPSHVAIRVMPKTPYELLVLPRELAQFCSSKVGSTLLYPEDPEQLWLYSRRGRASKKTFNCSRFFFFTLILETLIPFGKQPAVQGCRL